MINSSRIQDNKHHLPNFWYHVVLLRKDLRKRREIEHKPLSVYLPTSKNTSDCMLLAKYPPPGLLYFRWIHGSQVTPSHSERIISRLHDHAVLCSNCVCHYTLSWEIDQSTNPPTFLWENSQRGGHLIQCAWLSQIKRTSCNILSRTATLKCKSDEALPPLLIFHIQKQNSHIPLASF